MGRLTEPEDLLLKLAETHVPRLQGELAAVDDDADVGPAERGEQDAGQIPEAGERLDPPPAGGRPTTGR